MKCDHCGRQVPEGVFCTACGAHQGAVEGLGNGGDRIHRFAAHPGEHVASPNLMTTILPHLASHKVHEFRWALIIGVAFVGILAATGVIVGAIVVSAILVPSLYIVYLYEAQVYRDEPVRVLALTIGAGAVLGVAMTIIVQHAFSPFISINGYLSTSDFLIATVLIPLIQVVVFSAPALLLRNMDQFRETADGLVFGVAAGLGFAAAETIVNFSSLISDLPVRTDPGTYIYTLVPIAVFIPLLHGTAAGAVVAALWRGSRTGQLRTITMLGVPIALAVTVAFFTIGRILIDHGVTQIVWLGWEAVCVAILLLYMRFLLHHALIQEAQDMGFSPQVCSNCHKHIVAAGFCPACGMALSASPRKREKAAPPAVPAAQAEGA